MKIKCSILMLLLSGSLGALTLQEAVQIGVKNDPEIQSKIANYIKSEISVKKSQSGYYPKLDLTAGIGEEYTDRESINSAQTNNGKSLLRKEAALKFRQPIFEGLKTQSEVASVRATKNIAGYELAALYENKSLKIIQTYMNVLKAQDIIVAAEKNFLTHKEILVHIEKRYKQGVSNKADLLQIKGRVAGAQTDLLAAKNNEVDAQEYYLKTVGELPKDLVKPRDDFTLPPSKTVAIQNSIKSHPTMLGAQQKIEEQRYQKTTFQGGYYPHFFFDGTAQYQNNADGVDGTYDKLQAMLRMEWNLFNGAREKNEIEIAQQNILSARKNSDLTKRELVLETSLAWNAYQLLGEQITPLNEHVEYAKEVKAIYGQQYNVNKRTLVDVLNAQVEYFNADKALITAQYDKETALYRVFNSMGILNSTIGVVVKE